MTYKEPINEKDEIIRGIILEADFGFGMKYKDAEQLYLKLHIQQYDGHDCIQLFSKDKIGKLLLQYKGDYTGEVSIQTLKHREIYLHISDTTNGIPNAVSRLPPMDYLQYEWIRNDNWN